MIISQKTQDDNCVLQRRLYNYKCIFKKEKVRQFETHQSSPVIPHTLDVTTRSNAQGSAIVKEKGKENVQVLYIFC